MLDQEIKRKTAERKVSMSRLRMFKGAILSSLVIAGLPMSSGVAGDGGGSTSRYQLTKGRGYSVCEAFLRNLNAFPSSEPPMVCEQKIDGSYPQFSRPGWEHLEIERNLQIAYTAELMIPMLTPAGTQPPPFTQWLDTFEKRGIAAGRVEPRLRQTRLRLADGTVETVVSYDPGGSECLAELRNRGALLGPAGGHMFIRRDDAIRPLGSFGGGAGTEFRVDLLLYKKQPFFVSVVSDGPRWIMGLHPVSKVRTYDGLYILEDRCEYAFEK